MNWILCTEVTKLKVITKKREMQQEAKTLLRNNKTIGFVPTMGYLHNGHLKLVEEAKRKNDVVVMSIFVNPLQFGPGEDFESYPRDPRRDQELAAEAGVDILFLPKVEEMYASELTTNITVIQRTDVLCGKNRPTHFDGVVTVIAKLFHIVLPDRAYFGLKDAQQVAVITGLVDDLDFPVEIIPIPTIRENDGLAISSRNAYLTEEERSQAPFLYQSILTGVDLIENGERDPKSLVNDMKKNIQSHMDVDIDYIEILSYPELKQLKQIEGQVIIAGAVRFSKARLIDNIILDTEI